MTPPPGVIAPGNGGSIPLEDQLAVFDFWASRAFEVALDEFARNGDRVIELARERFVEGYAAYGDAMFRKDQQALAREMLEEFADAAVYMVAAMHRASQQALARRPVRPDDSDGGAAVITAD